MSDNRKFVIFDLDGTLIDSYECVLRCVNKTLDDFGLRPVIIPKSDNSKDIEDIFCRAKDVILNVIPYSEFKSKFDLNHLDDCVNDVKINTVGENLMRQYFNDGYSILILTNKLNWIANRICKHFFPNINFIIIGRDDINPIKSNWQLIVRKLADINICPGDCILYVGDSIVDYNLAESLSIKYLDILSYKPVDMKEKSLCQKLLCFFFSHIKIFKTIGVFSQILGIVFALYVCYNTYKAWNKIPSHTFEATLYCEGYSSKNSYCNLRLQIDAGSSTESEVRNRDFANVVQVYNSDEYDDNVSLYQFLHGKCSYLFTKHTKSFFNKISYYFLDFKVSSNISSKVHNKDDVGVLNSSVSQFSYIENPHLFSNSIRTYATGAGVLGFCKAEGYGLLNMSSTLFNTRPSVLSPWDIAQSNYTIQFNTNHIKCDTISIEFSGATIFSNMYPQPDKTTMSSIEFYKSEKIAEVAKNGLRFHTEFVELREMGSRRIFILSGVVSLFVSILASIIFAKLKENNKD